MVMIKVVRSVTFLMTQDKRRRSKPTEPVILGQANSLARPSKFKLINNNDSQNEYVFIEGTFLNQVQLIKNKTLFFKVTTALNLYVMPLLIAPSSLIEECRRSFFPHTLSQEEITLTLPCNVSVCSCILKDFLILNLFVVSSFFSLRDDFKDYVARFGFNMLQV